jgi:5-methylcytosine-specific restriction endonuclease McrA
MDADGPPERRPTFEHVIPYCRGGPTNFENLVAACMECNEARDAGDAVKFYQKRYG